MEKIVFVAAKRTPFGSFGGSFKNLSATDLAVEASKAALKQIGKPIEIDEVIYGNVLQTSADAIYLARHVALKSGLPISTPAVTVNRLCGSGFEAIIQGARLIQSGEAKTVLVGGTESMSQSPYVLRGARFGYKMSNQPFEDSLMAGLFDPIPKLPMALTAENLAEMYKISRKECDEFALLSQQRASEAQQKNLLADEISPVEITERKETVTISKDEHIRANTTIETLSKLKPVFKENGTVTAGNASGMVDGACSLILTTEENAKKNHYKILGEFIQSHVVGCDPKIMGIGPVAATQGLLKKANASLDSISFVEVNEAFAPQFLAVKKELGLDISKTNVNGGAISIGHPLGASGARLTTHLLYLLQKKGGGLGLGSACIGGGQGISVLIKV
jgi:acetyl-CoA acetyltransferase family protein